MSSRRLEIRLHAGDRVVPASVHFDVLRDYAGGAVAVIRTYLEMAKTDLGTATPSEIHAFVEEADVEEFRAFGLLDPANMEKMARITFNAEGKREECEVYRGDLLSVPEFAKIFGKEPANAVATT